MVSTEHGVTVKKVNVVGNQCTDSTNHDVICERSQVEEVSFTLITTQLWTRDLPFWPPFADIIRVVFPGGDHHSWQSVIGPTQRPYSTATRGCTITIEVV